MSTPQYFSAGLGDVIRVIYRTASYQQLSETTEAMPIVMASHNPFAVEIFRYHRNAKHFLIYDLAHKYIEFFNAGLRGIAIVRAMEAFVGFPLEEGRRLKASPGYMPIFDAPDNIDSSGHVFFAPFAGVSVRSFPEALMDRIVALLRTIRLPVFLVTRGYRRTDTKGRPIHDLEDASRYEGGNVYVLENLSVPATLNLLRTSCGFIGSWSSMLQAAWLENKPVATYYPPGWPEVTNGSDYAFGIGRANCIHTDYSSFDEASLRDFIASIMLRA